MLPQDSTFDDNYLEKKDPYTNEDGLLITKLPMEFYDNDMLRAEEKRIIEPLITAEALFQDFAVDSGIETLKKIHRYYFRTIFTWAGEFRTVNIEKEEKFFCPGCSLTYENHEEIYQELALVMWRMAKTKWHKMTNEKRIKEFADCLAKMWGIHPFRDGNTRAIIGFAKVYAMNHGFKFDILPLVKILSRPILKDGREGLSIRDCFVGATLPEYPEPEYLYKALRKAMT
ncbi:MAG: Fic family protein [Clostridia bacterium]|nr:Fic family protein [Clostridia bacterium]